MRTACVAASPSSDCSGSAYGRSLPSTMTSIPSVRTSASSPCGPYDEVSTNTSGSTGPDWPPRAVRRSWCTGASPAPAAKTSRSPGNCERPPKACHAHHAACSCATYPTTGAHHDGTATADGVGPGCTKTGLPASSATRSTSPTACQPCGWLSRVAGSWTPTNGLASSSVSPSRSGSRVGTDAQAAKWLGRSSAAPCQASMSAPASPRGSDSIPSGAERLTQASPIPALQSCSMRRPISWSPGRISYAGAPWVTSCRSRR